MNEMVRRLAALALFLGVGCGSVQPSAAPVPSRYQDDRFQTYAAFSIARERWQASGPRSYRYRYHRVDQSQHHADPYRPVIVEVHDGVARAIVLEATGEPAPDAFVAAGLYPTIDGSFAQIDRALQREPVFVKVSYHPELGYPVDVFVDFTRDIVDEELEVHASGLESR